MSKGARTCLKIFNKKYMYMFVSILIFLERFTYYKGRYLILSVIIYVYT